MDLMGHPTELIALLFLLAILPFIVIISTSFLKYAITLSLLRNALGLQQVPPNMAIYGLAIILTAYTMAPVISSVGNALAKESIQLTDKDLYSKIRGNVLKPYTDFLEKNTDPKEISFFQAIGPKIWKTPPSEEVSRESLVVLIPAFTLGQLTEAFKIGLLISLPFLAIDLIVSNLLLAMGMMMVSPITISMPFKLLIFILIGGWDILVKQLLLSYQ